jgi:hypothetical protein
MNAVYMGRCSCGSVIRIGDNIYFDKHATRVVRCKQCGLREAQLGADGLVLQQRTGELQRIIDRTKQLKMLPRPLSSSAKDELSQLISTLKTEFIETPEVVKFSMELGRRRFPTADFYISLVDDIACCALCGSNFKGGTKVLFARSIQETVCLGCPLEFEDVY